MPEFAPHKELVTLDGLTEDRWQLLENGDDLSPESLPEGSVLVPVSWWLEHRDSVNRADLGIWFDSSDEPEQLGEACGQFPVIAVNFPKFSDGRGYSIARLLRERYGYQGELRAIGDVLLDQLHYMKRCGFTTIKLRGDKDIQKARDLLNVFSDAHQAAVDNPSPLFRRRPQG